MAFRDDRFFHALQQHPDDNILRLVYADFLEERGDEASAAHAEFIRVQVQLATLPPFSRKADDLTARQDELLARWERVWLGQWADVLDGWTFRRGLVEAVRADASVFLDNGPHWFAEWPTLTVAKLTRAGGELPELAASPWLAHLRGLDLSDNDIEACTLAYLTGSRFICLLQALDLSGNPIGPDGARLLATAWSADELSELHLARCGLHIQGLTKLVASRSRPWRRLDLSGNWLDRRDLLQLVQSPLMPNLVALDLASNPLGDNGVSVLADSPNVGRLVDLGLCGTGTGDGGLTALATSRHLTNLRSLDLRGHHCRSQLDRDGEDWGGIGELSRSPLLGRLQRLLLGSNGPSNGWITEVLSFARPSRRQTVWPAPWTASLLRKSPYLMPSRLVECDLEELWWLGDTGKRERLPNLLSED